jgi:hypothetical protein
VSNEHGDPRPDRDEDRQAEQAAADLRDQMNRLKARYRIERRLLEALSFESNDDG